MQSQHIYITNFPIRLGQFLKVANVAQDGLEAKLLINNGQIKVNGLIENRRGRQLMESDIVQVGADIAFTLHSKK